MGDGCYRGLWRRGGGKADCSGVGGGRGVWRRKRQQRRERGAAAEEEVAAMREEGKGDNKGGRRERDSEKGFAEDHTSMKASRWRKTSSLFADGEEDIVVIHQWRANHRRIVHRLSLLKGTMICVCKGRRGVVVIEPNQ